MKFVCDRCKTRYSIADDKVGQKIVKIRCKTCGNVIALQESPALAAPAAAKMPLPWEIPTNPAQPSAPAGRATGGMEAVASASAPAGRATGGMEAAASASAPAGRATGGMEAVASASAPAGRATGGMAAAAAASAAIPAARSAPPPPPAPPPSLPADGWHLAISGQQAGPISRARLVERILLARPDDEVYVWREDFDGWKEPKDLPALRAELTAARARAAAPPPPPGRRPSGAQPAVVASARISATHAANGVVSAPLATGLTSLNFTSEAGAAALAPAPGQSLFPAAGAPAMTHAPSGLSRLTGLPGLLARYPFLKYVVAGVALVVIVVFAVIAGMKAGRDELKASVEPAKPSGPRIEELDVEDRARRQASQWFGARVSGSQEPVSNGVPGRSAPRRVQAAPGGAATAVIAPPPQPTALTPEQEAAARRYGAVPERRVAPIAGSARPVGPAQTVSDADVRAVISRPENKTALRLCYERALKRNESLRNGRLDVAVSIGTSGIVKRVDVSGPPAFLEVRPCIQQAVKRWMFPPSHEEYETAFPLILQGA